MDQPFSLKHLFSVVGYGHVSPQESTTSHSSASRGAEPSQSSASRCARIQKWATEHRKALTSADFSAQLDGGQVGSELMEIFRETPEFGRSLALRMAAFHEEQSTGPWRLIGGGGEATVFYDDANQQVIKLFAPPCKARFGWILRMEGASPVGIRPGELDEALLRFAWFEALFPTGLEIANVGADGSFLLLQQPFILGEHPTFDELHAWMRARGWQPWHGAAEVQVVRDLTWQRDAWFATDVRPENALVAASDGELRAIDFIVGQR